MGDHVADATTIIRRLTGNRWTWPPVEVVERYPVDRGRVRLTGRPIVDVASVTDTATQGDVEFTRSGSYLVITSPRPPCSATVSNHGDILADPTEYNPQRVEVTYTYGSIPPLVIQNAIYALAAEMGKADAGDADCRLPDRVTSVVRQGVTWTYVDPNSLLDNGRTGIYDIDLALQVFGGKPRARARVFTASMPPPDRISVTPQTGG